MGGQGSGEAGRSTCRGRGPCPRGDVCVHAEDVHQTVTHSVSLLVNSHLNCLSPPNLNLYLNLHSCSSSIKTLSLPALTSKSHSLDPVPIITTRLAPPQHHSATLKELLQPCRPAAAAKTSTTTSTLRKTGNTLHANPHHVPGAPSPPRVAPTPRKTAPLPLLRTTLPALPLAQYFQPQQSQRVTSTCCLTTATRRC